MGRITLLVGGCKSGKSSEAVRLAGRRPQGRVVFIATAEALDSEMKSRIAYHKRERPAGWVTIEEPIKVSRAIARSAKGSRVIIVDCITLLLSNLLMSGAGPEEIENEISAILTESKRSKSHTIIVSNEVGLSIVPANKLARKFRDLAGRANQEIARRADNVYFMIAGIPWRIK